MNGQELFAALGCVDDELVAEAENYTARKVIPFSVRRFGGALAACICLLIGWAIFAQSGLKSAEIAKDSNTKEMTTEAAVEETETEEMETEETVIETGSAANGTGYMIIAQAPPIFQRYKATPDTGLTNGTLVVSEDLQKTVDQTAYSNFVGTPRFLVAFDLYRDGEKIDPNSGEYAKEVQRLTELGYEFRTLYVKQRDKSVKVQTCALMTTKLLQEKDLSAEYGYFLYFPENENGTALDWNNVAKLSGLPTSEDAAVTKDYD
jgi:hypothetical protein